MVDKRRVDISTASTHNQPFKRRQSHGRLHRLSALNRTHTGTVAQMADDKIGLVQRLVEIFRGRLCDVHVARAVETVAADVVLLVHLDGNGINVRRFGDGHVESSVEDSDLRAIEELGCHLDAGYVGWVMQGRKGSGLLDRGHRLLVDDSGRGELLSAMHHPMTNNFDAGKILHLAALRVSQQLDHLIQGHGVVRERHLDCALRLTFILVIQDTHLQSDLFYQTAAQLRR
mmetsp:Transcript_25735/g.55891  ORF Transcript_25735/g.55891 Transcript_25735/m.55891 type:complete len:230 (-) Transcript_25735:252-941(-)